MDDTIFYVVGGVLVVLALLISLAGIRSERFPASGALMRGGIAMFAVVVVVTGAAAVIAARHEQQHRIEEADREAAEEAEQTTEENITEEAQDTEGEAADQPGARDEGAAAAGEGRAVFVETGCVSCHTLADVPEATGEIGPNLDVALENRDAEFIRTSIIDPGAEVAEGFPDNVMPTNYEEQLDETELNALVEFLLAQTSGAGGRQAPGSGGGNGSGGGGGSGGG